MMHRSLSIRRCLVPMSHEDYMLEALSEAEKCFASFDVPVGCVIVDASGTIIGRGRNRREYGQDATAHAEVEAIKDACTHTHSWRLDGCTLYVTLEPCPMCAGAIMNARISEVQYGAREPNTGCCGSVLNLFWERFPYRPKIYGGILAEASQNMLDRFFGGIRNNAAKSQNRNL